MRNCTVKAGGEGVLQLLLEPDTLRHISEEAETALAPRRDQGGTERSGGFPGGAAVKNPLASAGDARDTGSIPGSGRSAGVGNATCSSILAWKIPRTEEPGGM